MPGVLPSSPAGQESLQPRVSMQFLCKSVGAQHNLPVVNRPDHESLIQIKVYLGYHFARDFRTRPLHQIQDRLRMLGHAGDFRTPVAELFRGYSHQERIVNRIPGEQSREGLSLAIYVV
jgi:hypothetical protein